MYMLVNPNINADTNFVLISLFKSSELSIQVTFSIKFFFDVFNFQTSGGKRILILAIYSKKDNKTNTIILWTEIFYIIIYNHSFNIHLIFWIYQTDNSKKNLSLKWAHVYQKSKRLRTNTILIDSFLMLFMYLNFFLEFRIS